MGRPPLPLLTAGEINTTKVQRRKRDGSVVESWEATCKFRDKDGKTRPLKRTGSTANKAKMRLREAIRDRREASTGSRGEITAQTRVSRVAEMFIEDVKAEVKTGAKSPGTLYSYQSVLKNHVELQLGELRVGEAGQVWLLDDHIKLVRDEVSLSTAKTTRSVLSGIMHLCVMHGALDRNPIRDCSRLKGGRPKKPRGLNEEERAAWRAHLLADEDAVAKDLPDLTDGQMATGVRIGELLAVQWPEVDWDNSEIAINWTVCRVIGDGLRRKSTKSLYGERRLGVPQWYMRQLRARYERTLDRKGPIYPHPTNGGLRDPSYVCREIRRARGKKFEWLTSHNFRKTASKAMDEAGVPVREIGAHLGQGDMRVTEKHYLEPKVVSSPAAVKALESLAPVE